MRIFIFRYNNSTVIVIGNQQCTFKISENTEMNEIILNRWNVSCACPWTGYRWSSLYGICVDIDECEENSEPCNTVSEACLNLPGSFRCVCKWGYSWNDDAKKCEYSSISDSLVLRKKSEIPSEEEEENNPFLGNVFNKIRTKFVKSSTSSSAHIKMQVLCQFSYFLLVINV